MIALVWLVNCVLEKTMNALVDSMPLMSKEAVPRWYPGTLDK